MATTDVNERGIFQLPRPTWVLDKDVTECMECKSEFTTFNRKVSLRTRPHRAAQAQPPRTQRATPRPPAPCAGCPRTQHHCRQWYVPSLLRRGAARMLTPRRVLNGSTAAASFAASAARGA